MNQLYPVFLKLDQFDLLVVGGGAIALEKLQSIFGSSANAKVTLLAATIDDEVQAFIATEPNINWLQKSFESQDLMAFSLIIVATESAEYNRCIYKLAKCQQKLINVADTPALCDFYLAAIASRGDLKIAISTNGKSPTFAKRLKQLFEDSFAPETDSLLTNLSRLRKRLAGDFASRVKQLNKITESLIIKGN